MVLEYIEPMCIEAHLEAHVYDLYIPTHLGLEEYTDYSRHYGIISLGLGFLSFLSPSHPCSPQLPPPPAMAGRPPAPSLPLSSFPPLSSSSPSSASARADLGAWAAAARPPPPRICSSFVAFPWTRRALRLRKGEGGSSREASLHFQACL